MLRTLFKTAPWKGKDNRGFTYIEAILTTSIIMITVFSMAALFTSVNQSGLSGQMTSLGLELCEQRMEQMISDKTSKGYSYITSANYPASETLNGSYVGFSRTTQIQEVAQSDLQTPQSGSGYKRIDITVQWGPAAVERVSLSSLVAN